MGVTVTLRGGSGDMLKAAYDPDLDGIIEFPNILSGVDTFWKSRTCAADNGWLGVTYGNGLFVAVAYTGVGNRVMTSPDGITWTIRTSAADNYWRSVTYGNGLFVAVANTGSGNRVMTFRPPGYMDYKERYDSDGNGVVDTAETVLENVGAASDTLKKSNDAEVEVTNAATKVVHKTIRIPDEYKASVFRMKYDVKSGGAGGYTRTQIQKNGVNLGATDNKAYTETVYETISQDLAATGGDNITLTASDDDNADGYLRNFRMYSTDGLSANSAISWV